MMSDLEKKREIRNSRILFGGLTLFLALIVIFLGTGTYRTLIPSVKGIKDVPNVESLSDIEKYPEGSYIRVKGSIDRTRITPLKCFGTSCPTSIDEYGYVAGLVGTDDVVLDIGYRTDIYKRINEEYIINDEDEIVGRISKTSGFSFINNDTSFVKEFVKQYDYKNKEPRIIVVDAKPGFGDYLPLCCFTPFFLMFLMTLGLFILFINPKTAEKQMQKAAKNRRKQAEKYAAKKIKNETN